jgi:hypothetical protein
MISEQECTKILNAGEVKFSAEEVRQIRDLMVDFATIEYEDFIKQKSKENKTENSQEHKPRKAA